MKRWYVARTHANAETKAQFNLLRQGFECYLPTILKRRSHARKVENVSRPLFPRYLFICRNLDNECWRAIHSTIGVSHLVCQNERPVPVPEGVIERLRQHEDDKGHVKIGSLMPFGIGQKVLITAGAFTDQIGHFERLCADGRISILLELLGRHVAVQVPAGAVSTCA